MINDTCHEPFKDHRRPLPIIAPYDGDLCCRLGEIDGRHEPGNRYCLGCGR